MLTTQKTNIYLFALFTLMAFVLILLKVIYVPITHDEPPTALFYFNYSFWEIMMSPTSSPNNHILNSLLSKICIHIFGHNQWAVRIPNVLAYTLYITAIFRILKNTITLKSPWFVPVTLLFICNPYLQDFFGLCRGYGLSFGFSLLSLSYLLSGFLNQNNKHIWAAMALSILASYANFTTLYFWAATAGLVFVYFLFNQENSRKIKFLNLALFTILNLGYTVLISIPIRVMQSTDQWRFWKSEGFFKGTLMSIAESWEYKSDSFYLPSFEIFAFILLAILILNLIVLGFYFYHKPFLEVIKTPLFVITVLLTLTILANIFHTVLLDIPNLKRRTAQFLYPLFIANLAVVLSFFRFGNKLTIIPVVLISALSLAHIAKTYTINQVQEWWFDANTLEVLNYLDQTEKHNFELKTSWMFYPSFKFYLHQKNPNNITLTKYTEIEEPDSTATFYYIFRPEYPQIENNFEIVHKFHERRWLLKRRALPLQQQDSISALSGIKQP